MISVLMLQGLLKNSCSSVFVFCGCGIIIGQYDIHNVSRVDVILPGGRLRFPLKAMGTNKKLLEAICLFANKSKHVAALILIGSQARTEKPADEYSDIDLVMVVDDPECFLSSDDWLVGIGNPRISFVEDTIGGAMERRILFDNMLDVDFIIISDRHAQTVIDSAAGRSILDRGCVVLINKHGFMVPNLHPASSGVQQIPAENVFVNNVNDFWYHTVWTAKKLLRKELWAAKFCLDNYMKWKLLWMIERYEHAKHGPSYNTWYGGRFIDFWCDRNIKGSLYKTFARYEYADMVTALMEMMELFRLLANSAAEAYGIKYPSAGDYYATDWVRTKLGCPHTYKPNSAE